MAPQGSILVVDDELGPRESLRMILKPIYEVHTAENGQEALNYINRENVDLVTLDLKMPGTPGLEVLREIKKTRSDIEVVIITGYGTLGNAIEAIRYGAVDFISKPFNIAEIISIVSKSVERRNFNLKIRNLIDKIKDLRSLGAGKGDLSSLGASLGLSPTLEADPVQRGLRESIGAMDSLKGKTSANYMDFLKVLIYILESKEPNMNGHAERVALYCEILAQDLGLSASEKEDLQMAALLHDIGKLTLTRLPAEKDGLGQNSDLDFRQHPAKGVHLIEPLAFPGTVTSAILHHHERWDGKGYPDGLSRELIPKLARIINLANSYDLSTMERSDRRPLSASQVQEEIKKNAGLQFDPNMVGLLLRHFNDGGVLAPIYRQNSLH